MACCNHWIKGLMFLINALFALSGIAIITIGALIYTKFEPYGRFLESQVTSPPIILIIVGSIIFVVAFLGCCGAITDSNCMLILYATLLAIIFLAELGLGIYVLVAPAKTDEAFNKILKKEYDITASDQAAFQVVSQLQRDLHCCGVNGPQDFMQGNGWNPQLYMTCCPKSDTIMPCTALQYYKTGCARAIADAVKDKATIIGGVGIGLALIEIAGIINAVALTSYNKRGL